MGVLFSKTQCQHTSHVLMHETNYSDATLTQAAWLIAKMSPFLICSTSTVCGLGILSLLQLRYFTT